DRSRVPAADPAEHARIARVVARAVGQGPLEEGLGQDGDERMAARDEAAAGGRGMIEADPQGALEALGFEALVDVLGEAGERRLEASLAAWLQARAHAGEGAVGEALHLVLAADRSEGLLPLGEH